MSQNSVRPPPTPRLCPVTVSTRPPLPVDAMTCHAVLLCCCCYCCCVYRRGCSGNNAHAHLTLRAQAHPTPHAACETALVPSFAPLSTPLPPSPRESFHIDSHRLPHTPTVYRLLPTNSAAALSKCGGRNRRSRLDMHQSNRPETRKQALRRPSRADIAPNGDGAAPLHLPSAQITNKPYRAAALPSHMACDDGACEGER